MSSPVPMTDFKSTYKTVGGVTYYDILNEYETDSLEVIKSKCLWRLGTFAGEWQPDPEFGFPASALRQNSSDPDALSQLVADQIQRIENVAGVNIVSKTFDSSLRVFTCSLNVFTVFGDVDVDQQFF